MRKRSVGINVRVSVTEKRKMTLMAKRCGLSLSEYLRQRALGYEPAGIRPRRDLMYWTNWMKWQKAVLCEMAQPLAPTLTD